MGCSGSGAYMQACDVHGDGQLEGACCHSSTIVARSVTCFRLQTKRCRGRIALKLSGAIVAEDRLTCTGVRSCNPSALRTACNPKVLHITIERLGTMNVILSLEVRARVTSRCRCRAPGLDSPPGLRPGRWPPLLTPPRRRYDYATTMRASVPTVCQHGQQRSAQGQRHKH